MKIRYLICAIAFLSLVVPSNAVMFERVNLKSEIPIQKNLTERVTKFSSSQHGDEYLLIQGTITKAALQELYSYQSQSIQEITCGCDVLSIGPRVFLSGEGEPPSLKSITFNNELVEISTYAFGNCTTLTNIVFGSGIKAIRLNAFNNCTKLKDVQLPDSIETLGNSAFNNCSSLTNFVFGSGISSIGTTVFNGCTGLQNVTFRGKTMQEIMEMPNYPFGIRSGCTITGTDGSFTE